MAQRIDYAALQRLSAGEWENYRAARVDRLAEALAATRAAGRALPAGLTCGLVDLRRAADELRSELRAQLAATNPFVTSPADSRIGLAELEELRRECGYDPEGDKLDRCADRLQGRARGPAAQPPLTTAATSRLWWKRTPGES
jgi:hypothetical protein